MNSNMYECEHSQYNLDETWGFYVDIENMKPVTLNTEKNNTYDNYAKKYDYSIKGYDTEIFCMDEDIENDAINKNKDINVNDVNVHDINVNDVGGLIITAALSYLIFLIL
jgi:hypothetical protein